MINICISINSNISLASDNFHLASGIILFQNQHNIFLYLPNQGKPLFSLPETLSETLIPFLGEPQTSTHCGPGGAWIENFQSNPTQTLFVEGVLMPDQHDPSSSQQPNLALMFLKWYTNILFLIESSRNQDFKLEMPKKYDPYFNSQCQLFTPTQT
ncbi:hypothetical protein O181_014958 [Austropuccinia psidii MF-1]|uniref:Uncharacterized protein n=1 Tax=Austropuccinia psidii MF-1 TaxID=1389203 RepID=A0A9Q3C280_9BASI|nr:hypothetical protein [Austropuccinia psidii MF-1]